MRRRSRRSNVFRFLVAAGLRRERPRPFTHGPLPVLPEWPVRSTVRWTREPLPILPLRDFVPLPLPEPETPAPSPVPHTRFRPLALAAASSAAITLLAIGGGVFAYTARPQGDHPDAVALQLVPPPADQPSVVPASPPPFLPPADPSLEPRVIRLPERRSMPDLVSDPRPGRRGEPSPPSIRRRDVFVREPSVSSDYRYEPPLLFDGEAHTLGSSALLTGSSAGDEVVAVVPAAAEVEVLGPPKNDFSPVRYEGLTGWAPTRELQAGKSSQERPAFEWPLVGRITSYFGPSHPLGIDISTEGQIGLPILAARDGVVVFAGGPACCNYGWHVIIDHGDGYSTLYAHLSSIKVWSGKVVQGQVIGLSGNTGFSTGPHLHFELRLWEQKLNPLTYLP